MTIDRPPNTWWRRVPRSRARGVVALAAAGIALVLTGYALATDVYTTTSGVILETVVLVLPAWSVVSLAGGLAALRNADRRR